MARLSILLVLAALWGATVYELLVAFSVIEMGSLPGEGAAGSELVGWLAAVGLIAAALLSAALRAASPPAPAALLAPAAGAFLLAYFHTFDPYYLPTLLRFSERDFVPPVLVFVLAAAAGAAGLVTLRRRRVGLSLSAPAILMCALAAFWTGIGH